MKKFRTIIIDEETGQELFNAVSDENQFEYRMNNDLEEHRRSGNVYPVHVSRGFNFRITGYQRNENYANDFVEAMDELEKRAR